VANYLISIIRPQGYLHSNAFLEIAETLQYGLRGLGHSAYIKENAVDSAITNILLGAHLLTPEAARTILPGSVLYNLEQWGSAHLREDYYHLARKHQIWDYSPVNLEKWQQQECLFPPKLVEIGYVPELRRIAPAPEQDIDVLFYGSVNEHRRSLLLKLQEAGVRVHAAFSVYGRERDALIARSKIVLNAHYYESNLFEAVRVSYLLANSKAVVSEISPDIGGYAEAVAVFPYEQIVEGCLDLLRDDGKRKALEARGFAWFSQRPESRILSQVLSQPDAPSFGTKSASPGAHFSADTRSLYLDMVQKCLINVIYEDANHDRWSAHQYHSRLRELGHDWPSQAHSMIGNARMSQLRRAVEIVIEQNIPGDLIETGVWRGGACIMMRAVLKAYGVTDRRVWVADSFCGLPTPNPTVAADAGDIHHTFQELAVSLAQVQANFAKYGLLDHQVEFLKGWFSETLPHAPIDKLAILRLDGDMYESTMDALNALYDKLSEGGFLIVDDFGAVPGCQKAIMDFRRSRNIQSPSENIDGRGVFWRKNAAMEQLKIPLRQELINTQVHPAI
jgi:hypothetical protein